MHLLMGVVSDWVSLAAHDEVALLCPSGTDEKTAQQGDWGRNF